MSELSAPEQTKLALNTIGLMDFGRVSVEAAVGIRVLGRVLNSCFLVL
jgi:hypothetical protein